MKDKIAIIGLGYVGLPLAYEFAKKFKVVGFNRSKQRVVELKKGFDRTLEISREKLDKVKIKFTTKLKDIQDCNIYIIAVNTPINIDKTPDLTNIKDATKLISKVLKKDDLVIFESTLYPGCVREVLTPILSKTSGLEFNKDFFVGYSPSRINPGNKEQTICDIAKVVSGSNKEVAKRVKKLYKKFIKEKVHIAPYIEVAEASKLVENIQRDINISFMNELALIFDRLNIDTYDVLECAKTKWNFLPFTPGLIGGLGDDTYYLIHRAKELDLEPNIIISSRKTSEYIPAFIAKKIKKLLKDKNDKVLILGITAKENSPNMANSKALEIVKLLTKKGVKAKVYEKLLSKKDFKEYGIIRAKKPEFNKYNMVVLLVAHQYFKELEPKIKEAKNRDKNLIIYDIKAFFEKDIVDVRL